MLFCSVFSYSLVRFFFSLLIEFVDNNWIYLYQLIKFNVVVCPFFCLVYSFLFLSILLGVFVQFNFILSLLFFFVSVHHLFCIVAGYFSVWNISLYSFVRCSLFFFFINCVRFTFILRVCHHIIHHMRIQLYKLNMFTQNSIPLNSHRVKEEEKKIETVGICRIAFHCWVISKAFLIPQTT